VYTSLEKLLDKGERLTAVSIRHSITATLSAGANCN
jgi:hypothetical protein